MKSEKIFFVLSLMGILILIFLSQTIPETYVGEIESIQYSNNRATIKIKNSSTELILFELTFIKLEKNSIIEFQGRKENYKGAEQIILDKIILLDNS